MAEEDAEVPVVPVRDLMDTDESVPGPRGLDAEAETETDADADLEVEACTELEALLTDTRPEDRETRDNEAEVGTTKGDDEVLVV